MKKRNFYIALLFAAVYFTSYLTRTNYAAVLIEMIRTEGFTKEAAALALTVSAITYGLGQVVSGYLGDRFKPEKIIFFGLVTATVMNLLIPLCPSAISMSAVWGVNGFAQAMIWPPMVKMLAGLFEPDEYKKACVFVSWGSSVATISIYLVAPLIISFLSWRAVFIVSACAGAVISVIWAICSGKLDFRSARTVKREDEKSAPRFGLYATVFLVFAILAVAFQGLLRDGFTTWTPTLLSEKFNFSASGAILSGVVLPIFSMVSLSFASFVSRKMLKNELFCAGFFFVLCLAGSVLVRCSSAAWLTLIAAAIAEGGAHGANYSLTCLVPPLFAKHNKTSLISGLLNGGTYIGSAFSASFIASLLSSSGWDGVELLWIISALAGAVICAALALRKRKIYDT